jgi:hypothetical protein
MIFLKKKNPRNFIVIIPPLQVEYLCTNWSETGRLGSRKKARETKGGAGSGSGKVVGKADSPGFDDNNVKSAEDVQNLNNGQPTPNDDNAAKSGNSADNAGTFRPPLEWSVVRPDELYDGPVSPYEIHESPAAPDLFHGLPTTRSNVARFMLGLVEESELWCEWKFRMPCVSDRFPRKK